MMPPGAYRIAPGRGAITTSRTTNTTYAAGAAGPNPPKNSRRAATLPAADSDVDSSTETIPPRQYDQPSTPNIAAISITAATRAARWLRPSAVSAAGRSSGSVSASISSTIHRFAPVPPTSSKVTASKQHLISRHPQRCHQPGSVAGDAAKRSPQPIVAETSFRPAPLVPVRLGGSLLRLFCSPILFFVSSSSLLSSAFHSGGAPRSTFIGELPTRFEPSCSGARFLGRPTNQFRRLRRQDGRAARQSPAFPAGSPYRNNAAYPACFVRPPARHPPVVSRPGSPS